MADPVYPSTQRVGDIAGPTSAVVKLMNARSFSALELALYSQQIHRLETLLSYLAAWVQASRSHSDGLSSFHGDFTRWNVLVPDATSSITIGELKFEGIKLATAAQSTAFTPAGVGGTCNVTIKLSGAAIGSVNLDSRSMHSYLKLLPSAIYNVLGGQLEHLAGVYWRGDGPAGIVLPFERRSFVNLQGNAVKNAVEAASKTVVSDGTSIISGDFEFTGWAQSRDGAELILRSIAPDIAAWVLDETPLGTEYALKAVGS